MDSSTCASTYFVTAWIFQHVPPPGSYVYLTRFYVTSKFREAKEAPILATLVKVSHNWIFMTLIGIRISRGRSTLWWLMRHVRFMLSKTYSAMRFNGWCNPLL